MNDGCGFRNFKGCILILRQQSEYEQVSPAFTDHVVLITGGGRGIGRATALAFAADGARVAVTSRSPKELSATVREIRALGGQAISVVADVSAARSVTAMVRTVTQKFGPVDVLVNNAGVLEPIGPVWATAPSAWRKCVRVNLEGTYLCARAVLPAMMQRKRGVIINVSTGAARNPRYGWSAYCAGKATIDQLTRVMAVELKEHQVNVNGLYPGTSDTRMQELIRATPDEAMGGDVQVFRDRHAHGLNLSPQAPARLIVWLAQQRDMTGQIVDIYDPTMKAQAGL
jgi:NAD(P)-dependent dehydrogenase (short-subunit alcohol dehydrogenase family)